MSNENVVSMVDSLTNGDNVAAQDAFKSALTDKILEVLELELLIKVLLLFQIKILLVLN